MARTRPRRPRISSLLLMMLVGTAPGQLHGAVFRGRKPPQRAARGDIWIDPRTGMRFCYVPAGPSVLGTDLTVLEAVAKESGRAETGLPVAQLFAGEGPPREVSLPGFWIGQYEVTNAQYRAFLRARPRHRVPALEGRYGPGDAQRAEWWRRYDRKTYAAYVWDGATRRPPLGRDRHPVTLVSVRDAEGFCQWAGYRLPTEAEWEKAAAWYHAQWPMAAEVREAGPGPSSGLLGPDWQATFYPWGNTWHWWTNCADFHWRGCLRTKYEYMHGFLPWINSQTAWLFPGAQYTLPEVQRFTASLVSPVGALPDDKSPYGCLDMAGNVSEICAALARPDETFRYVVKGGSFRSPWWECRAQARAPAPNEELRRIEVGFRCLYDREAD